MPNTAAVIGAQALRSSACATQITRSSAVPTVTLAIQFAALGGSARVYLVGLSRRRVLAIRDVARKTASVAVYLSRPG